MSDVAKRRTYTSDIGNIIRRRPSEWRVLSDLTGFWIKEMYKDCWYYTVLPLLHLVVNEAVEVDQHFYNLDNQSILYTLPLIAIFLLLPLIGLNHHALNIIDIA